MPSQTAPISHLSGRRVCGLEGAVPPPSTLDKETANWHIVMAYQKNLEAQVRVPGHTPPLPSRSGMSLGFGTRGTEVPPHFLPPPPPLSSTTPSPLFPNPQVTLPDTLVPPLSPLVVGSPLCRCVEHTLS